MAGAAVATRRRAWWVVIQVAATGLIAAISVIPYFAVMRNLGDWNILVKAPKYNLAIFFGKLSETLSAGGSFIFGVWIVLVIIATLLGLLCLFVPVVFRCAEPQRDVTLFLLVALVISSTGYFLFLKLLSYQTQAWYYLDLLAVVALAVDGLLASTYTRH